MNSRRLRSQVVTIDDDRCKSGNHDHEYCTCHGAEGVSPEHTELIELMSSYGKHNFNLGHVLKSLFYRIRRMEGKVSDSLREALHRADHGDVPNVKRIVRNVLEDINQSPDGVPSPREPHVQVDLKIRGVTTDDPLREILQSLENVDLTSTVRPDGVHVSTEPFRDIVDRVHGRTRPEDEEPDELDP